MDTQEAANLAAAVARVTKFTAWPRIHELDLPEQAVWVLYTGDGWRLPNFMAGVWRSTLNLPAKMVILGPDNLMVTEKDGMLDANDFRTNLIEKHELPAHLIVADASKATSATHGQAAVLAKMAKDEGWTNVVLFTSNHHALRAFMNTVRALKREGIEKTVRITPCPAYALAFDEHAEEMIDKFRVQTTWGLFSKEGLQRVLDYMVKHPQNMATWEEADEYLTMHGY